MPDSGSARAHSGGGRDVGRAVADNWRNRPGYDIGAGQGKKIDGFSVQSLSAT